MAFQAAPLVQMRSSATSVAMSAISPGTRHARHRALGIRAAENSSSTQLSYVDLAAGGLTTLRGVQRRPSNAA